VTKYFLSLLLSVFTTCAYAVWDTPARQVQIYNPGYTNIGQEISAAAPTNTLQAYFNWMDIYWNKAFGGSQTPWLQDINGADFTLTNARLDHVKVYNRGIVLNDPNLYRRKLRCRWKHSSGGRSPGRRQHHIRRRPCGIWKHYFKWNAYS
jgi:hypothetical protein